MSSIPPSAIGSVLQSGLAQQVQGRDRDTEANERADADRKLAGSSTADIIEIEATDTDDTEVHTDTGGTGGQGRFDAPPEEAASLKAEPPPAITVGPDGKPHLDVSA